MLLLVLGSKQAGTYTRGIVRHKHVPTRNSFLLYIMENVGDGGNGEKEMERIFNSSSIGI